MNLTLILSAVSLGFAAVLLIVSVALLGTPLADIGMLSTVAVFALFGIFGLLLARAQGAEAA